MRIQHASLQLAALAGVVVSVLVLSGCSGSPASAPSSANVAAASPSSAVATASGQVGAGVVVNGLSPSVAVKVTDVGPQRGLSNGIAFVSDGFELGPSGALPSPAQVTLPLTSTLEVGSAVVVATREQPTDQWSYLPATLGTDGRAVSFTTIHFSIFTALFVDLGKLATEFKTDFIDGIDGGATQTVAKPSCANQSAARSGGYSVSSSTTDTVYWCFGEDGSGNRILKITDHRRYPLEIAHPGLLVVKNAIDYGQLASLSHFGSGSLTVVAPGGTVTYQVSIAAGQQAAATTQMDGLGQSLYALQTGVETLFEILTKFGAGSGSSAIESMNKLLTLDTCADSIGKGSGALISGCLSPKDLLDAFGVKALLIAPLMAVGSVIALFHSEWNALVDQFNGHDHYQVSIHRAVVTAPAWISQIVRLQADSTGYGDYIPYPPDTQWRAILAFATAMGEDDIAQMTKMCPTIAAAKIPTVFSAANRAEIQYLLTHSPSYVVTNGARWGPQNSNILAMFTYDSAGAACANLTSPN